MSTFRCMPTRSNTTPVSLLVVLVGWGCPALGASAKAKPAPKSGKAAASQPAKPSGEAQRPMKRPAAVSSKELADALRKAQASTQANPPSAATPAKRTSAVGPAKPNAKPSAPPPRVNRFKARRPPSLRDRLKRPSASKDKPEAATDRTKQPSRTVGSAPKPAAKPAMPAVPKPKPKPPAEQRKYMLSFEDATWDQILKTFCRWSDLTIIGDMPISRKKITYINPRQMTYHEALHVLNTLLMEQGPNYWLVREKNFLTLRRMSDWFRYIPAENRFETREAFEKALAAEKLDDDSWAMVFYTPESKSVGDLIINIQQTMPDNVIRVAPMGDTSRLKITGICFYIRQFIGLCESDMFKIEKMEGLKLRRVEFYKIERADAALVHRTLQTIVLPRQRMRIGGTVDEADRVDMVLEQMSNTIIVKAKEEHHLEIKKMIDQIEKSELVGDATFTTIKLEHAQAEEVATILNPLLQRQAQMKPSYDRRRAQREQVYLQANPKDNTLIVLAVKEGLKRVQDLLKQLDVESPEARYRRIVLKNARADQILPIVNNVVQSRQMRGRRRVSVGQQLMVTSDPQGNALFVMGNPKDIEYVEKLVQEIDSSDTERTKPHIVKLKKASPSIVAQGLQAVFAVQTRGRRSLMTGSFRALPDEKSRILIVICLEKDWKEIEPQIKEFDEQAVSLDPVMRTLEVKNGDAEEIAQTLGTALRGRIGRWTVVIGADRKTNTLFVTTQEPAFEQIESLVQKLDVPRKEGKLEVIPLRNANASEVAALILQMFAPQQRGRRRTPGGEPPQIIPDVISNALVVRATKTDLMEIEIQAMRIDDAAEADGNKPTIIQLEYADPSQVSSLCQALFIRQTGRRRAGAQQTTFFMPTRTGLVVKAPAQQMPEIQAFIKSIDSPESENIEIKTVQLPGQDVERIATILQQMFSRGGRGRRGAAGSINFMPDPSADMLVITAPKKRFEEIDKIIKQYTEGVKVAKATMRIFDVKNARVDELAELLIQMLGEKLSRGRRRSASRDIRVLRDQRQNKLIVFAPEDVLKQAEEMVKQLDVPVGDAGGVQWIMLKNTEASYVANALQQLWSQKQRRGRPTFHQLPVQIWPEAITNSILVSAPADEFKEIEALATKMDEQAKAVTTQPSITPLEYADPPYVVSMCQEMFLPQTVMGRGRRSRSQIESISFVAMRSGVMVRAPQSRMKEIEEFIKRIDVPEETQLVVKRFHMPKVNVESLHQTLQTVFGRAARRRGEPPISFLLDGPAEAIVATCHSSRIPEITKVIEDFKKASSLEEPSVQEMVPVVHTRASYAASVLDDMLRKQLRQRSKRLADRLGISVDDRQNKVIIYAPKDVLETAKGLLKEIDVPVEGPTTQESGADLELVKWIPVENEDASAVANRVAEIWAATLPPQKKNENRPQVRIWAEPITNSVLVSHAFGKDFQAIKQLVEEIDAKSIENPNKPVFIKLEYAEPGEVSGMIQALFVPRGRRAQHKVMIERVAGGVVIRAPKVEMQEIQEFIKTYDKPDATGLKIKTFYLPQTDVSELSSTLRTIFGYKKRRRNEPGWNFIPNTSADMLMVLAPEARMKEIDEVVKEYQENVKKTSSKMQMFEIKNTRASYVVGVLNDLLREKLRRTRGRRAVEQLQISAESRQNKVVVFASDEVMKQVEEMIKQVDVELTDDTEGIKWIEIINADASEVASAVNNFYSQKRSYKRRQDSAGIREVRIWPEMVTNSLLVSAPKKEFDEIAELAKKIDEEYAEKGNERIKITPKFITVGQVQSMINQLFYAQSRRRDRRFERQRVRIIPAGQYSFFLEGPKDKLPEIKKMIDEMDTEGENAPIIKTYKMGDADVRQLARALSQTTGGIGSYIPEPRRGALIVSAPKHQFDRIEKAMEQLKAEIQEEETQFEVLTLQFARPSEVRSRLEQLVSMQLSRRRSQRDRSVQLAMMPDDNNNRLFVYAAPDEMALVKKMLEQLDIENLRKEAELHTLPLKRTDCEYMAGKVREMFTQEEQRRRWRRRGQATRDVVPIRVVPEPTTNTLLITCTDEDLRDIELFVAQLEDAFVEKEKVRELITPKFVSQSQLMTTVNAIYNPPSRRGKRYQRYSDIRAIPAGGSSFFLEAPKDKMVELKKLIEELDTEGRDRPVVRTYKMKDIDVRQLTRLLQTTMQGKGSFMADPRMGMVIISAREHLFDQIEEMMNKLQAEIEETRQQFEVIELKFARPSEVYSRLNQLVSMQINQRRSQRGMGVQLSLMPDDNNNRLFVYAGAEELALVKKMLVVLDIEDLKKDAELHAIALDKTDCSYMAGKVQQVFSPEEQRRLWKRRGKGTRDVIPIRVVPEDTTNTLLITCAEEDFKEIEKFVKQIEEAYVKKEKVRELITPKFVSQSQLMATINAIYEPPRRRGVRRKEIPDIRAIPAGGSSFFLEAPKDKIPELKKLIEELDVEGRDQPVVRTYKMKDIDVRQLTRLLQTTMQGKGSFMADPRMGMVIISAREHLFGPIEEMMKKLQAEIEETRQQFEVIELKFARPSEVTGRLNQLVSTQISQRRSKRDMGMQLSLIPDDNNNRLFVYAAEEELALVKKMLEVLDVENLRKDAELQTIALNRTDCSYMAGKIREVFTQEEQQRRWRKRGRASRDVIPIRVVPEPTTNTLLITCTEEDFREIELFVAKIEDAFVEKEKVRELITPKYVSQGQLMSTINAIYNPPQRSGRRRKELAEIRALPASGSSFYLEAPKDKMPELKKLVAELDVEDQNRPVVKTYKVGDVDVRQLVRLLQSTMQNKGSFIADPQMGMVIVSAPEFRFKQIEETMERLQADIEETRQAFKVFPLKFAKANNIYSQLSQLVSTQASYRRSRRGRSVQLTIMPDSVLNRLFVYAGDEEMKLVEDMLEELDIEGVEPEQQVYSVELVNADCSWAASMVQQMFTEEELRRRRRGRARTEKIAPIRVVADQMSNRLLVWASPQDYEDVEKFVKELDERAKATKPERRILEPKFVRANELYSLIQTLFLQQRRKTGQRTRYIETFMVMSGASIILNGPKDRLDEIEDFVQTVDTEDRAKLEVKTFELPEVDINGLVSMLNQLFAQDTRKQRGNMLFIPDVQNNELMVSAPKSLMADIEEVISKKQENAKKRTRTLTMVEIEHADANYLASMLRPLIVERTRSRRGRYAQTEVTITPESRTNRLLIMAGEAETKVAQELIAELDTEAMGLKGQVRTIELKKADASYVASTLQAMFSTRQQRRKSRTYTATPVYLIPEVMTNRVFVAASEADYKEIEKLAMEMDAAAELQGIQREKIEIKYAAPGQLVSTITQMFQPLQTRGRRQESDVRLSVVGSNIVAQAPASKMVEIKKWIEQLDVEEFADTQTKFFTLEIARAQEIQGIIQPMLQAKAQELQLREGKRARRGGGMLVVPDVRNNRLIITAQSQLLTMAEVLIEELDVEDPAWTGETVEIIALDKAEATAVSTILSQVLLDQSGQKSRRPRKGSTAYSGLAVTVVPDASSNTLILKGLPRELERVKKLIADLEDKAVAGGIVFKLHRLVESDAEEVAQVIQQMAGQLGGPRARRNPLQVTHNYMMNAVFVAGTPKQQSMVEKVIEVFETPEMVLDPNTNQMVPKERAPFEFIQLVHSDAQDLLWDLESLLEKHFGEKGPTLDTLYDDRTVLLVSGKPDQIKVVKRYVDMFEKKNSTKPDVTRTVDLGQLNAKEVKEQLELWPEFQKGDKIDLMESERPELLVKEITIRDSIERRRQVEDPESKREGRQSSRRLRLRRTRDVRFVPPGILGELSAELNGIVCSASASTKAAADKAKASKPRNRFKTATTAPKKKAKKAKSDAKSARKQDPKAAAKAAKKAKKPPTTQSAKKRTAKAAPTAPAKRPPAAKPVAKKPVKPAAKASAKPVAKESRPTPAAAAGKASPAKRASAKKAEVSAKGDDDASGLSAEPPAAGRFAPGAGDRVGGLPGVTKGQTERRLSPVTITIDPKTNTAIIKGPERRVTEMEDVIYRLQDEISLPYGDEMVFRVYDPQFMNVNVAATLLDTVFNGPKTPVQTKKAPAKKGEKKDEEKDERMDLREMMRTRGMARAKERIRAVPDAWTGYLIVMASPETHRDIIDLLAKVDVPGEPPGNIEYYHLKNAQAQEVEALLKTVLKLETTRAKRLPALPKDQNKALKMLQQQLQQVAGGSGAGGYTADQVTITSSASTNTLIVMAPDEVIDVIDTFIEKMEAEAGAIETEAVVLETAMATQVAQSMTALYARRGVSVPGKGTLGGGTRVTITAEPSSNTVYVRAPQPLRDEIIAQIKESDARASEEGKPFRIVLEKADAEVIAPKLQAMFATRKARGKQAVQVIGDNASDTLIIRAPESVREQIQEVVKALDVESVDIDFRVIPLEHANAMEIHQQLVQMTMQVLAQLRAAGKRNMKIDVFAAVPDPRTNSLIVTGGEATFAIVEKLKEELDVEPRGITEKMTVVYPLEQAQAADVASAITRLYRTKRGRYRGKTGWEPPEAEYDATTNTLIVVATDRQHKQIKKDIIDKLEEFSKTKKIKDTTLQLQFAKSDDVAEILTNYFAERQRFRRRGRVTPNETVSVLSEPNGNVLLVRCNEENLETIKQLVSQMDREEIAGKSARETKVIPLEFADPGSASQAIRQAFASAARRGRVGLRDRVDAIPEYTTGSLVVAASEENMKRVDDLIAQLDVETTTKRETKKIKLEHADADEVASQLTRMYAQIRGRTRRGQLPVTVTADARTNSVLVTAKQKELAEVEALVKTLDVPSDVLKRSKLRIFQLEWAEPSTMAQMINQSFRSRSGRRSPSERVYAGAEYSTGSLIVHASPDNMQLIEQLVKDVDQEGASTRQMHVVEVVNGEASDIADALNQMFVYSGRRRRGGQPKMTIVSPTGTNKVMVLANETDFKRVQAAIKELDVGPEANAVRVVRLTHIAPEEAQTILQEFLRKPGRRGRYDPSLLGDVRITVSPSAGTLILTARKEKLDELETLVKKIDVEVPEDSAGARKIAIFPLEYANAYYTAQAINQAFTKRGRAVAESERVTATAEGSTGTVIVSASRKNLEKISKFIEELDKEDKRGREVRVRTLTKARATDVAQTLTQIYRTRRRTQRGVEPVTVTAEAGTNSLIIAAKKSEHEEVDQLLTKLDVDPTANEEVKVVALEHIDAPEALTIMEDYLQRPGAGRRGDLAGGTRVSALESMNAIVFSGQKDNVAQAEKVILGLDQPSAMGDRQPKIIPLQAAQPSLLAAMLEQIFTEPARQQARGRRGRTAEQMIPLIIPDENTGSLIVRARKTDFNMIEQMAKTLDREDVGGVYRLIPVPPTMDVVELATKVETLVNESEQARAAKTGKRPSRVAITYDDRTSTLIVAGAPEQFAQVERLVQDLQKIKPAGAPAMRLIQLKNLQADDLRQVLDEMMERSNRRRSGRRSWRR